MAAFSLGPIASGLPKDTIDRLMEVERRPLEMLEQRKKNEEDRLNLVSDLTNRLNQINSEFAKLDKFKKFRELGSNIGRPDLMSVSVDKEKASSGEYSMQVVQLAGRSSMLSNGFTDPNDTQIGVGYFSYDLPNGETREVFIDEDENTLYAIANKINRQRDLDLQALVVNDGTASDSPWRLIVTHNKTGEVNDAEFPTFYFTDGDEDFYMDQERPAQNSVLKVNGFDVEFPGTTIDTLFPGITIDLKDADPGKEFTLKIFEDREKVEGKVVGLVQKINEVLSFIQKQNTLDENSNTSNTLGGDVTIQNLESAIRRMVLTPIDTSEGPIRFHDLGVSFQKTGLLEVNESALRRILDQKFDGVAEFFTGMEDRGDGFVGKITNAVKSYTQSGGVVQSRSEGIKRRIKEIDKQIENTQKNLEQTRQSLQQKFSNLESTMARLKGQQAQVQSVLGGGGGLLDTIKLG